MIGLLPYVEESALYNMIQAPQTFGAFAFNAGGSAPWDSNYELWGSQFQVKGMNCPSDSPIGDLRNGRWAGFQDITDGTSNTMAISERCFPKDARSLFGHTVESLTGITANPALCLAQVNRATRQFLPSADVSVYAIGGTRA